MITQDRERNAPSEPAPPKSDEYSVFFATTALTLSLLNGPNFNAVGETVSLSPAQPPNPTEANAQLVTGAARSEQSVVVSPDLRAIKEIPEKVLMEVQTLARELREQSKEPESERRWGAVANRWGVVGGIIALASTVVTGYFALRHFFRRTTADNVGSSILIYDGEKIHQYDGDTVRLADMYPNRLDRHVVNRAMRNATTTFGNFFIDPEKYWNIVNEMLAKEEISKLLHNSPAASKLSGQGSQVFITVLRRSLEEGRPELYRDIISLPAFGQMLLDPLGFLSGRIDAVPKIPDAFERKERALLEGILALQSSAAVALLHPELMEQAIACRGQCSIEPDNRLSAEQQQKADIQKARDNVMAISAYVHLDSQDSIQLSQEAVKNESLNPLRQVFDDHGGKDGTLSVIHSRQRECGLIEKYIEPALRSVSGSSLGVKRGDGSYFTPKAEGLYNGYSIQLVEM